MSGAAAVNAASGRRLVSAGAIVACVAACKLAVHLYAGRHYGYFVDELYYLACSRHLDWGYVDQPPLIALLTWVIRKLLGESLPAIRLLPALAGTAEVILTALLARELGGNRFAQRLAAVAALVSPGILAGDNLLSMNAFEPLFWLGCAWLLIRILKTGNPRLWIWFGVLAGVGLENKHSMLIFGAAVVVGLLLTPQRKIFSNRWIWIAGAIAFLIFLPNLWWNIRHHFPFFELQANIRRSGRDVPLGPIVFFGQEILTMHPLTFPLWVAGIWFFFGTGAGKPFRALGWAWVFTSTVILIMSPRVYYLYPAFPLLFAAGAVMCEHWQERQSAAGKLAWPALLIVTGAMLAPLAIPVLPPETYIRYTKALHLAQPAIETHRLGPLPQIFADQFGWEDMARAVAKIYHGLPREIQAKTAIFGQNYGQAGAIDLFGPKYGLPGAISGHQTYFLWGPRGYTGESMIVMAGRQEDLERRFARVERVAQVGHSYAMPYEHFDIFYCRGLKPPLSEIWPQVKNWD
ncbi:MAG: glycosyltransferase family 39 protein [Bryobacteraceae bacterium]